MSKLYRSKDNRLETSRLKSLCTDEGSRAETSQDYCLCYHCIRIQYIIASKPEIYTFTPCERIAYTHTHTHTHIHTHTHAYTCTLHRHKSSITFFPLPPSSSEKPNVTASSMPLVVQPRNGARLTLFAEVTSVPCPTIQWRLNGSAISSGGNYLIGNPCSSAPATSYYFSLTITTTVGTAGTYNATLSNPAGTAEVPDVFVTPRGMLDHLNNLYMFLAFLLASVVLLLMHNYVSSS